MTSSPTATPSGASGRLVLHVRDKDGVFGVPAGARPVAQLGQRRCDLSWGRNELELPTGTVRLSVWVGRRKTSYGAAHTELDVRPGQQLELHYSPPVFNTMKGRIADGEQPFAGKALLAGLLLFLLAVLVFAVIMLIVTLV